MREPDRDEFMRMPGVYRSWELHRVLIPGRRFRIEPAGRDEDAGRVADRAMEIQDDLKMRAGIVSTALKAQQSRGWLIDLIDGAPEEAQPKLAPLRQKLEALLRG